MQRSEESTQSGLTLAHECPAHPQVLQAKLRDGNLDLGERDIAAAAQVSLCPDPGL